MEPLKVPLYVTEARRPGGDSLQGPALNRMVVLGFQILLKPRASFFEGSRVQKCSFGV